MARPRSEEKQEGILQAASRIIAAEGIGASTASIAKEAGVATGSLFIYYPTKDALLNALYLCIKAEVAEALLAAFPAAASPRERARHAWNRYIGWALQHPDKRRTLDQLALSHRISPETVSTAMAGMGAIGRLVEDCIPHNSRISGEFAGAMMTAFIGVAIDFAERQPDQAEHHIAVGFDALWRALSK